MSTLRIPKLVARTGPAKGQEFPLRGPQFTIGSKPGCDLLIRDAVISAQHAQIVRGADGRLRLRDHGSKNGTRVNDRALAPGEECVLSRGDFVFFAYHGYLYDDGRGLWTASRMMIAGAAVAAVVLLVFAVWQFTRALRHDPRQEIAESIRQGRMEEAGDKVEKLRKSKWGRDHQEAVQVLRDGVLVYQRWQAIELQLKRRQWPQAEESFGFLAIEQRPPWSVVEGGEQERLRAEDTRRLLRDYLEAQRAEARLQAAPGDLVSAMQNLSNSWTKAAARQGSAAFGPLGDAVADYLEKLSGKIERVKRYEFLYKLRKTPPEFEAVLLDFESLRRELKRLNPEDPKTREMVMEAEACETAVRNLRAAWTNWIATGRPAEPPAGDTTLHPYIASAWENLRTQASTTGGSQ